MWGLAGVSMLACAPRPVPVAETPAPEPELGPEPAVAEAAEEPLYGVSAGTSVSPKLGFRMGEACTLEVVEGALPVVAADGSEVVLMGRYDTYYYENDDIHQEGVWREPVDASRTPPDYQDNETFVVLDWFYVDSRDCSEAERAGAQALDEANAYLANGRWLAMEEIENVFAYSYANIDKSRYACVSGEAVHLCTSDEGFDVELFGASWENEATWVYVNLRICVAAVVQYEQRRGPWTVTAIEVFDVSSIVSELPAEYLVECGDGQR